MKKSIILWIALLWLGKGFTQNTHPCQTEGHRQFDFWLGEWEVYHTTADTLVGHNHIKNILNTCVIEENWTGASGFQGKSFNTYNPVDSTWNQVWVDVSGATYHFSGRFKDDVMALEGMQKTQKGTLLFKLNFHYDRSKDIVRQIWKMSNDGGTNWGIIFDGTYRRRT
ncbi:MAG: hypothetical protein AAF985_17180 [Bacteroidota bacterium]